MVVVTLPDGIVRSSGVYHANQLTKQSVANLCESNVMIRADGFASVTVQCSFTFLSYERFKL